MVTPRAGRFEEFPDKVEEEQGRLLRLTIGDVKNWSIGKAREEARLLGTQIDRGIDPISLCQSQGNDFNKKQS